MSLPNVEIDLNDINENGQTVALLIDADQPLTVGKIVVAFESEDQVAALAMVARIDEARGIAFLWVDWASMSSANYASRHAAVPVVLDNRSSSQRYSRQAGMTVERATVRRAVVSDAA